MPTFRPVMHLLSLILLILGAAMLLPALFDLRAGWQVFVGSSAVTITCAGALYLSSRGGSTKLDIRQAFLLTSFAWTGISAFAALPFALANLDGVSYADGFFEAVSGLTTTGSTVLVGLDEMPRGILVWRALLQWLGGIGIIVMAIAILPFLRVGGMQLFRAESSERNQFNLRVRDFSRLIIECYLTLTLLCMVAYWAGGMSLFDAFAHALTTLATGGYSTSDQSMGKWPQPMVQWAAVTFMLAGALPFLLYIQVLRGRPLELWRDPQVRWFLTLVTVFVLYTAMRLWLEHDETPLQALTLAAFNVVSIITTTGYASTDYTLWGNWAVLLFFFIMFLGGCSGSTAGAIKIYRFYVLAQSALAQLKRLIHPHGVFLIVYRNRQIDGSVRASVAGFVLLFFVAVAVVTLLLTAMRLDFLTAISAATTALTNVGPGLGDVVGPASTFRALPEPAKWLLSAAMLLGRLELFTILVLFMPRFWRG